MGHNREWYEQNWVRYYGLKKWPDPSRIPPPPAQESKSARNLRRRKSRRRARYNKS